MFELGTKAETIREMTTVWFKGRYDIGLKSQNRNNGEEKGKNRSFGGLGRRQDPSAKKFFRIHGTPHNCSNYDKFLN